MLQHLITSKTRLRLLLKFFLDSRSEAYLRQLAKEFGDSTNAVRVELNNLTEAGLLQMKEVGNTKVYKANTSHASFQDLQHMVRRFVHWDRIYPMISEGHIESVYFSECGNTKEFECFFITRRPDKVTISIDLDTIDCRIIKPERLEEITKNCRSCFLVWSKSD
ncbi:hypothetical protein [Alteribacillus sp. HJP-4]|uniref:hypothetical protein n=1 Tax=Alteribacillus sp. HJP-4 TaxID=2775394 RepID=UPI0035CD36E0